MYAHRFQIELASTFAVPFMILKSKFYFIKHVLYTVLLLNSGQFSKDGITQKGINDGVVRCTSSHLTSFAVLVDTSGSGVSILFNHCK